MSVRQFTCSLLIVSFSFFSILSPAEAASSSGVGTISALRGEGKKVLSTGQEQALAKGDTLFLGEVVSTGPESYVTVKLWDDTIFDIGPNSSIAIDEFVYQGAQSPGKVVARILKGFFRFVTGKIVKNDPDSMKVNLPVGFIGIRGTTVSGRVEGDRSLVVLATSRGESPQGHRIYVANTVGGELKITELTQPGYASIIEGREKPPSPSFKLQKKDDDEFRSNLDPPESPGPTPPGNPPGGGGSGSSQPDLSGLEGKLKVEGIVHDAKKPDQSMAIVNGQMYQRGETVDGFQIVGIESEQIRVREEASGREGNVRLSASPDRPKADGWKSEEKKSENEEKGSDEKPKPGFDPFGFFNKKNARSDEQKSSFNPVSFLNKAWETQGLAHLRNIHTAAMVSYSETDEVPDLKTLGQTGILPPYLADGEEGKYRFQIVKESPGGVGASADPLDPQAGLLHFYIDPDGKVHSEKDRTAGPQSPEYRPEGAAELSELMKKRQKDIEEQMNLQ